MPCRVNAGPGAVRVVLAPVVAALWPLPLGGAPEVVVVAVAPGVARAVIVALVVGDAATAGLVTVSVPDPQPPSSAPASVPAASVAASPIAYLTVIAPSYSPLRRRLLAHRPTTLLAAANLPK